MNPIKALLSAILIVVVIEFTADLLVFAEESHEQVERYGEIIEAGRRTVADEYGMLHMRFTIKDEFRSDSKLAFSTYQYEFWTLNDSHFRIDAECVDASDATKIGQRTQFIVNDLAYATLYSPKSSTAFSVTDTGTAELGGGLVRGKPFFHSQIKMFGNLHPRTGFPRVSERSPSYSLVTEYIRDDSGRLSYAYTNSVPAQESTQYIEATLDSKNSFVVLHAKSKTENAGRTTFAETDCTYDAVRFGTIPVTMVTKTGAVEDLESEAISVETTELGHVDHAPIQLAVFDLPSGVDAVGSDGAYVWGRRLVFLLIAAICACTYAFLRRRKLRR